LSNYPHSELAIIYRLVKDLIPHSSNARTHSRHQIRQIAESVKTFGFTNPVLIDRGNTIIAGHGRVAAAKLLGIDQVPTIRLEGLTDDHIRAYIIADNRLAEKAGWDKTILAIELQHLKTLDAGLDVTVTGFEIPEINLIIQQACDKHDKDDVFDIADANHPVTRPGDQWHLGGHRVLCGSSLESVSYKALLSTCKANLVFVDPPYDILVGGHACGNSSVHHRNFGTASREMTEAKFAAFLTTSLRLLALHSTSTSIHFVCVDWHHLDELLAASKQIYDALLDLCVWVKEKGGTGSLYRSRHELVLVFRNGKIRPRNNVQLEQKGRTRTNVWEYRQRNNNSREGIEGKSPRPHPAFKPVALVADAILDSSARGDIVMDPFLGSGTTLIAAERVGRTCFGMEIDPTYIDTAVRRWQRHTGDHATHSITGKRFDDLAITSEVIHD